MADLVIRGMEMPKDCPYCFAAHYNKFGEFTGCNAVHGRRFAMNDPEYRESTVRPAWCPLVAIPEGHGRLIDGDELASGCDDPHLCRWLSEIEDAPTIVPAEKEAGDDG